MVGSCWGVHHPPPPLATSSFGSRTCLLIFTGLGWDSLIPRIACTESSSKARQYSVNHFELSMYATRDLRRASKTLQCQESRLRRLLFICTVPQSRKKSRSLSNASERLMRESCRCPCFCRQRLKHMKGNHGRWCVKVHTCQCRTPRENSQLPCPLRPSKVP